MPEADDEKGAVLPLGEYLRNSRESQGLTLDQAARVTRIGKNYLQAMEDGKFEKLPNPAYIKGFLRLYASFLSLSGDEVVQLFEQETAPQPVRTNKQEAKNQPPVFESMEKAKFGGRGRWLIPLVLLVLVLVAAWFFNEEPARPPRPAPPRPVQPQPSSAKAVQPPRSSAGKAAVPGAPALPGQPAPGAPGAQAPAPGAQQALPPTVPAEGKPKGVILRLHLTRDTWLSITIDDSLSQRYDLKSGDVIEWKGARSFVVDVGDGGAVDGEFNGRPLKALGEPGKPAHVELKGE